MAVVQTWLGGNDNASGSVRRCGLGVNIAAWRYGSGGETTDMAAVTAEARTWIGLDWRQRQDGETARQQQCQRQYGSGINGANWTRRQLRRRYDSDGGSASLASDKTAAAARQWKLRRQRRRRELGLAAEAAAAAAARLLDGIKISNETAAIASTEAVQTGLGVNGSGNSSGRRRLLGVTIAAKRRRRDDRNGGSDGVGASLVWFVSSGW